MTYFLPTPETRSLITHADTIVMHTTPDLLSMTRKAFGMSQRELGAVLGLTDRFIGMMERGQAPIERRTALALWALVKLEENGI